MIENLDPANSKVIKALKALAALAVAAGLYLTSYYSYLLFHTFVELFSVAIAWGVFALTWNSRRLFQNNYLLLLGIAYLFIGNLDILHTLAYKGMNVFPGFGANLPTQLWLAARYLESLSFFIAPFFLGRTLNPRITLGVYSLCFTLILLSIFFWQNFPTCYVEGEGLTTFKIAGEYVNCGILLAALALLYGKRREFDAEVWPLVAWSLVAKVAAATAFTLYVGVYDLFNMIGHYCKVISFYLIYKAIIETGLVKPFSIMLRDLKHAEADLRKANEGLESQVEERTQALLAANARLRQEIDERLSAEASLRESERKLHRLSSQIIEAQEQERKRISRELHDDLGQSIIVKKLALRKIYQYLPEEPERAKEGLEDVLEEFQELLEKVRRISHHLSPTILEEFGLEVALENLFEDFSASDLEFSVDMDEVSPFLSKPVQFAVYRIFQEALTNISKHAGATKVTVRISRDENYVRFLVADNGRGFDPDELKTGRAGERGMGLASIEERVHFLNGLIDIRSQKGEGTQVGFSLPMDSG